MVDYDSRIKTLEQQNGKMEDELIALRAMIQDLTTQVSTLLSRQEFVFTQNAVNDWTERAKIDAGSMNAMITSHGEKSKP